MKPAADTRGLMREEKKAFARLKDLVRKYRMIISYVSGRSAKLEEKISKLRANRDETEKTREKVVSAIEKAEKKIKSLDGKMVEILIKKSSMISQYNACLGGRLPMQKTHASAQDSLDDLAIQRNEFLINATKAFSDIEKSIKELEKRKKSIENRKKKARKRMEGMHARLKIINKKVVIYHSDIAAISRELETHHKNEHELEEQYADLVSVMNSVPDLSPWALKLVEEAFTVRHPDLKIVELAKPVTASILQIH